MKNMIAYPYHSDLELLINFKQYMLEYNLAAVSSYKEDLFWINKILGPEVKLYSNDSYIQDIDAVLLLDSFLDCVPVTYTRNIARLKECRKELLGSPKLVRNLKKDGVQVKNVEKEVLSTYETYGNCLKTIECPVVGVLGMGEDCGKFRTLLSVQIILKAMGYKVLSICANPLGGLFGMFNIPDILFGNSITFSDKVFLFNEYVYGLCSEYNPEIVLIEFPGGILPFGIKRYNFFSEIPLVISSSIVIDFGIMNVYYDTDYSDSIWKELKELCQHKYNIFEIEFVMSDHRVEFDINKKTYSVLNFMCNPVAPNQRRNNSEYADIFEHSQLEIMVDRMISLLASNIKAF